MTVVSLELTGTQAAIDASTASIESIKLALAAGLYQEAEQVMTDSKANYCPVDIGVLRASGFVDLPEWHGPTVTVQLGYGGAAEPYALTQHEELHYHHKVGQAKFLETPMLKAADGMDGRLTEYIQTIPVAHQQ